mgnify:CR=1 FL=1
MSFNTPPTSLRRHRGLHLLGQRRRALPGQRARRPQIAARIPAHWRPVAGRRSRQHQALEIINDRRLAVVRCRLPLACTSGSSGGVRCGPTLTAAAIPFASAGQQPAAALEPARVALLVDTSAGTSASLTQLRAGLAAFIDALPPGPDILFVTTGRRIQVRVPPTTDRQKVKESIAGLLSDGGPTPLMDGLLESGRAIHEQGRRPPPRSSSS